VDQGRRERLPGILSGIAGLAVLLLSLGPGPGWSVARDTARSVGLTIVGVGMALVVWAAFRIRLGMLGEVEPAQGGLVKRGPYRLVRHPVYLGMTIALCGIPVALRSWLGLIGVLLLFLPSEIYRARLEERALFRRFGSEWVEYATRTGFLLPFAGIASRDDFEQE